MLETFTNPPNSALLRNPMMCRYFFPEEVQDLLEGELAFSKSNGITHEIPPLSAESDVFIFAWKYLIIIGDKHARRLVKKYTSYKDMAPDLIKFFPMLDPQEVLKACEAWSEFEVVVTAYDSILWKYVLWVKICFITCDNKVNTYCLARRRNICNCHS